METSQLTKHQKQEYYALYSEDGDNYKLVAKVRYDDECGNGHNSFAVTGDIYRQHGTRWVLVAGGCVHDEIAEHIPKLQPFIKWHLMDSDGPLHYVANTLYHATNRENGFLAGEVMDYKKAIQFDNHPILYRANQNFIEWIEKQDTETLQTALHVVLIEHKNEKDGYQFTPKYSVNDFTTEWYKCPFDSLDEANEFTEACKKPIKIISIPNRIAKGKERDLQAARNSAIWPEATDEQLTSDNLEQLLLDRLPSLVDEFKKDLTKLGFIY